MDFRTREAQTFKAVLADPQSAQKRMLAETIIAPNVDTEFGKRHGFTNIKTLDDYRRAVPVQSYEGFAPYIDRIYAGEQGLLTQEPVKRFFVTSGSTSKPKLIPVTSTLIRNKSRAFGLYWEAIFEDHPGVRDAPMVTNFSDSGRAKTSPGGLPYGSESSFWSQLTAATQLRKRPIIPRAVARIEDHHARAYAIARVLLEEEFAVIMTLNPSTIVLLLQTIARESEALATDIERGGIGDAHRVGDEVRQELQSRYAGNARRAADLRSLATTDAVLAHRLWPKLALAVCWRSPMLAPYLELLAPHFQGVGQRDYIMMASEAVMAIPLADGRSGGPLAVDSHFYEFIPEDEIDTPDPNVLAAHELEVGGRYVVVLSNGSGLYRYNIGDVVRVTDRVEQTPAVEFLHRAGSTCSLTGEKLTEDQVARAVRSTCADVGLPFVGFTVTPAPSGFPRYIVLAELQGEHPTARCQAFGAAFDAALGAQNVEYVSKRESERLGPPELWVVAPGSFERLRQERLQRGTSDAQIKPVLLTRDRTTSERFEVMERHVASPPSG